MSATLKQAQRYAQLKGSKVFETPGGHALHEDGSITFVMMSGPKLTFTEAELDKEIKTMEKELARQQAILAIGTDDEQPAPVKSKAKEK